MMPDVNLRGLNTRGEHYRIMVVEDSIFVQKQMNQILVSEGFKIVDTATNGEEAIDKYKEKQGEIDLITMDITMPHMDGITALGKLVEFDPKVIVIIVSALGKEDLVKKALILGAKHYIVKPLNRERMISRISYVLQPLHD